MRNYKHPEPDTTDWELSDLVFKETLGTGTFGRVRLCQHRSSDDFFAIKVEARGG